MNLLAYILSSFLLSWLGVGAYLLLRWSGAPLRARRALLWLVVGMSLVIPIIPSIQGYSVSTAPPAQDIHDFCHCENPGAGEIIHYQTSRLNDVLLEYREGIWAGFAIVLGLVLLRFAFSLIRLAILTRRHSAESILIEGKSVRLVRDFPGVQAGALWLGGRFVFWKSILDSLPQEEKESILLHEYSHIRQGNTLERLFLGLTQAVWFFNPAYYFISRELTQLSEYTADAFVVGRTGRAKDYARLLLKMKSEPQWNLVPMFRGGELKARIGAVLNPEKQSSKGLWWVLVIALGLVLPAELAAGTAIDRTIKEIAVYEFMTEVNHQTGKDSFCKKCTYEMVDACY